MHLLNVHKRLRPRWMDLLHDMGQSEFFAIDGESLALEAILFSRSSSQVLGGQPIAAVYFVERLLEQLLERGGRFTTMFYDTAAAVWRSRISAWATRQVLISHLTLLQQQSTAASGSAAFDIVTLPCFWGSSWMQRIGTLRPKFVLVTDAFLDVLQQQDAATPSATPASSSTVSAPQAAAPAPVKLYELLMLASFKYLLAGVDLVYLGQLQFDPLTALGFLVAAQKSYRYLPDNINSMVAEKTANIARLPLLSTDTSSSISVNISNGESQESVLQQQLGSWRLAAAVASCRTAICSLDNSCLQRLPTNESSSINHSSGSICSCAECWYAAVFLLHAVLLDILPYELRSQPAADATTIFTMCRKLDVFSKQVLTAMGRCLQVAVSSSVGAGSVRTAATGQSQQNTGSSSTSGSAEAGLEAGSDVPTAGMGGLADPWDGHLLLWLLVQIATTAAAGARQQLPAGNSMNGYLRPSDIIEGLGERGRQQFAAAVRALAQGQVDKHSEAATLAAVEALLINCVPSELLSWASRLPAGVPGVASGSSAPIDAMAAAAVHGAQLLTNMKQRNPLLSQIFAQFNNSSPTTGPAVAAAVFGHHGGFSAAMSTGVNYCGGTAGHDATAGAGGCQEPRSSSSVRQNHVDEVGSTAGDVVSGSVFGVGVFQEKYHWHVRRELEPAFFREVNTAVVESWWEAEFTTSYGNAAILRPHVYLFPVQLRHLPTAWRRHKGSYNILGGMCQAHHSVKHTSSAANIVQVSVCSHEDPIYL